MYIYLFATRNYSFKIVVMTYDVMLPGPSGFRGSDVGREPGQDQPALDLRAQQGLQVRQTCTLYV